jgi:hypothetical protein
MVRQDPLLSDAHSSPDGTLASIGDLIRPRLLWAFPLLVLSPLHDERFRLLLDASAQRGIGSI